MEKIKEFLYPEDPNLTIEENLRIKNRSNHKIFIHQALFKFIDEFAKRIVKDIHNTHYANLFDSNQLNIVSDEDSLEQLLCKSLVNQGHNVTGLSNPEMIYKGMNFIKPDNLLPGYDAKLYLIKQIGISENGQEKNYVLNPYFFGFKISLDIFINSLICSNISDNLEEGLVQILTDKYGSEYRNIYNYVAYVATESTREGARNADKNDETFISWIHKISGITDKKVYFSFVYESAMRMATIHAKALKEIKI